ncbi:RuBisCO large subunit C-terminal-like domain-containing protein [Alkalilimnicola sp. S0819]|uniref:RuBisCO large subunit C-terminal-like domain-containing protein n=1 Tax=Alkalilimnicola sp. S0819 TaxID=2613922 RepID=UPI0012621264|nr:RuBisCO large subunit C-terminal-like domain-containing protein [Alkalilimnicola sp. S0819]KAB7627648.1 ribulose 1,5-bisphosphate carboxylase [Alkalilimnicola sp. S0819]MPQ15814.1 ribulose 1,5-bisphosphate carboxylase [Alkalilimnicola sp. S0819]
MSERLRVHYHLQCAPGEAAEEKARGIALEQTVELPDRVLSADVRQRMVGRIEELRALPEGGHGLIISYAQETLGGELTQLLNVLFGNISLKDGIHLARVEWPEAVLGWLGGPGHGIAGVRERLGVSERALLCTALKPMGSSAEALATAAHEFALGGIDIIKDDHGLANQPDAPFLDRLRACSEAVARANAQSGGRSQYFPNVTAGYAELPSRLRAAKEAGCQGVLINPWITGLDAMRWARDEFGLLLMAHPAMTGGLLRPDHGLAAPLLLGELFRLAGADAVIYPNAGGRFGFSEAGCEAINRALRAPLPGIRPALPTPGGGMDVARAGYWVKQYGLDTVLLIGGSLYAQGDIRTASRALREAVEQAGVGA